MRRAIGDGSEFAPSRAVTRRDFVRTSAFATAACATFSLGVPLGCGDGRGQQSESSEQRELAQKMLEIFVDPTEVAPLGREYLAITPEESTRFELLSRLTEGWQKPAQALALPALHTALREQLRVDFLAGRTLRVNGWLLARSEARLAALAALVKSS
jgi:hypothetical protein